MRLHTDTLTDQDIRNALRAEINAGRIAPSVAFKTLTLHRSTSHARAFEVQLTSYDKSAGDGRRLGNSGSYGSDDSGDYAATYDEWGWLIGALYALDESAVWGSVARPQYADREDFDYRTGLTYNPAVLLSWLHTDEYGESCDPYPYRSGRAAVGRRGAGRVRYDESRQTITYCTLDPRNAADYRAFARVAE